MSNQKIIIVSDGQRTICSVNGDLVGPGVDDIKFHAHNNKVAFTAHVADQDWADAYMRKDFWGKAREILDCDIP